MLSFLHSAQAEDRVLPDDSPSLEVLEYLGQLVESGGELVGPEHFDDDVAEQIPAATGQPGGRDEWISRDSMGVNHD